MLSNWEKKKRTFQLDAAACLQKINIYYLELFDLDNIL